MINPNNPSAPLSASAQAKLDKEKLSNSTELTEAQKFANKYKSNGESSGNENLCVFGNHNVNFNKYNV